jgi:hypothetical protein
MNHRPSWFATVNTNRRDDTWPSNGRTRASTVTCLRPSAERSIRSIANASTMPSVRGLSGRAERRAMTDVS